MTIDLARTVLVVVDMQNGFVRSGSQHVVPTVVDLVGRWQGAGAEATDIVSRGGWTDLLICGIATESCVVKTAVDAFERGLIRWVLTDATASHAGDEAHAAGLLVAGRFIGSGQLITITDLPTHLHAAPARHRS